MRNPLPLFLLCLLAFVGTALAEDDGDDALAVEAQASEAVEDGAMMEEGMEADAGPGEEAQGVEAGDEAGADESADADEGDESADADEGDESADADEGDESADADEGDESADADEGDESADADEGDESADADEGDESADADEGEEPALSPDIEEVIVISEQLERSDRVVSRVLSKEEIFSIPGLRDDALGAIATYAAVATLQSNFEGPPTQGYYFRGGNLTDNHFEIDGLEVGYIYHLGGPFAFSVINGRLVEQLKFYASNPRINYPNVSGGVIEVGLKQPSLYEFNQEYDIGTLSTGAMVEGGFGNGRDGFWFAARRSYIDFFLNAANIGPQSDGEDGEDETVSLLRFPEFYDLQGRWYRELDNGFTDLTFIFTRDKFLVNFDGSPDDPQFEGDLGNRRSFFVAGWRLQQEPSNKNLHRLQINFLYPRNRFVIGRQGLDDPNPGASFEIEEISRALSIDYEHSWKPIDEFRFRYGLDVRMDNSGNEGYIFLFPSPDEGVPSGSISSNQASSIDENVTSYRQEAYLELSYQPSIDLSLDFGVRTLNLQREAEIPLGVTASIPGGVTADSHFDGISPRVQLTYSLSESTSLFYRWGDYLQLPQSNQLNALSGNPDGLGLIRSRSNLFGLNLVLVGHRLQHDVSLELWHRELHNLVIRRDNECVRCYSNSGSGLAYGTDVEWTFRGGRDHYFRVAYSWLVTERRNNPQGAVYPSAADQPHTLKLLYSGPMTQRTDLWRWGIFLTFNSGQPYTPIVDRELREQDSLLYFEPIYGGVNSDRFSNHLQINLSFTRISPSRRWEYQLSFLSVHSLFRPNGNEITYDGEFNNLRSPDVIAEDFLIPSFVIVFRP